MAGCRFDGRPLAAAWAAVPRPADPVGALWLAATVLREHRGDGHVLAGVASGLRGLDATVTFVATGAITPRPDPADARLDRRGLGASVRRLRARGLLDSGGRLTKTGGALRREVEDLTDRLAAGPVERLGSTGVERAIELATPVSRYLIDAGVIPVPNPIGAAAAVSAAARAGRRRACRRGPARPGQARAGGCHRRAAGGAGDRAALERMLARCTGQTRYRRFHGPVTVFPERYLTEALSGSPLHSRPRRRGRGDRPVVDGTGWTAPGTAPSSRSRAAARWTRASPSWASWSRTSGSAAASGVTCWGRSWRTPPGAGLRALQAQVLAEQPWIIGLLRRHGTCRLRSTRNGVLDVTVRLGDTARATEVLESGSDA